jgi:hypothetical protein
MNVKFPVEEEIVMLRYRCSLWLDEPYSKWSLRNDCEYSACLHIIRIVIWEIRCNCSGIVNSVMNAVKLLWLNLSVGNFL